MIVARSLASDARGAEYGSVVTADFQTRGRGRGNERVWLMKRKSGLAFTISLRRAQALTLRLGLAVTLAIEDFAPRLTGKAVIKWPNDILINDKKIAGILCESDGEFVYAGVGINLRQKKFQDNFRKKASSISLELGRGLKNKDRFCLLELALARIHSELETPDGDDWKLRLEKRLYKINEEVLFRAGSSDSFTEIKGKLAGIGQDGELLITPRGAQRGAPQPSSFTAGELVL